MGPERPYRIDEHDRSDNRCRLYQPASWKMPTERQSANQCAPNEAGCFLQNPWPGRPAGLERPYVFAIDRQRRRPRQHKAI
jgi:hypothetical protein